MSAWARAELGFAIYGAVSMLLNIADRLRARRAMKKIEEYGRQWKEATPEERAAALEAAEEERAAEEDSK